MDDRQTTCEEKRSTSKCAPSIGSIQQLPGEPLPTQEASAATSPPMKLVKSYRLENGWIHCRYILY